MSSLKTLFVAAFLVAGLCGVYLFLNYNPEANSDNEVADGWTSGLDVSTGTPSEGSTSPAAPQWNSDSSSSPAPSFAPTFPSNSPSAAAPTPVPVQNPSETLPAPYYQNEPAPSNGPSDAPVAGSDEPQFPTPKMPGDASGANPSDLPITAWPPEASPAANPTGAAQQTDTSGYGMPPANAGPLAAPIDREDYSTFMGRVSEALAARRLGEAHLMLSERYTDSNTTPDEKRQLQPLLDQLAGTVIYSPQSHLEAPYEVLANDTLKSIAEKHFVPTGLLVKINGLDPNAPLRPGQQIKVVSGPFEAVIDRDLCELTLMLKGERYAGRFPIGIGPELRQEGTFMVTDKRDLTEPGATSDNSLGTRWIGLGQHMGLHGTNSPEPLGRPVQQGCINLGQRDIEDLYDILSVGSTVKIQR